MDQLTHLEAVNSAKVLAVIMGGGQGTRLYPLTRDRAKPAVPLGGKYRLVDIPISNSINSGIKQIFVLTQFKSASLHRHIQASYKFDRFTNGFVEISAAQQGFGDEKFGWYQGTADAVRQNLHHFFDHDFEYILILSGDQLYRMNFKKIIAQHLATNADITIAVNAVNRKAIPGLGVLQTNAERRIVRFEEKPKDPAVQDTLRIPGEILKELDHDPQEELFFGNMGIYVFSRDILIKSLDNDMADFGKNVIPSSIKKYAVYAYPFIGYWEDIGTIGAFFDANLDLTSREPKFDLYNPDAPIYTRARHLPASKILQSEVFESIISEGCVIARAEIRHCVIGIRSLIHEGAVLKDCIIMGNDYYESPEDRRQNTEAGTPNLGIGKNCSLQKCIVDKNVKIGDNVRISPGDKKGDSKHALYHIRDGIVVISKNTVIPAGTVI